MWESNSISRVLGPEFLSLYIPITQREVHLDRELYMYIVHMQFYM